MYHFVFLLCVTDMNHCLATGVFNTSNILSSGNAESIEK